MASKQTIEIDDLQGLPFINRSPCDALDKLKIAMTNARVSFQTRGHIRTIEYAWQLVNAGIGAALLPNWQEIEQAPELVLRSINTMSLTKDIGLAYQSNGKGSEVVNLVCEVCQQTSDESP